MIPHELNPRKIKLPETDNHSIVLITKDSLRHQRFAYRMQKEFGDLVLAWYQIGPASILGNKKGAKEKLSILCKKVRNRLLIDHKLEEINYYVRNKGLIKSINELCSLMIIIITSAYLLQRRRKQQAFWEKKLFQPEIEELKQDAKLKPVLVKDPNSEEFIESIKKLKPYFFLSLGGPLYKRELLESVRGVAINQHAGWAPTYKGSNTIDWALYHRSLDYVGSTVHITMTSADAGPILRRSHPCLVDNDTPESCFARVVALGTELMIEAVKEIISDKEVTVYDQPMDAGKTYLNSQLNKNILKAIDRDFSNGWLKKELLELRNF